VIDDLVAFRGRRVLVTGHTGFKGSWLTLWLNMLGADVFGFALSPPSNGHFRLLGIERRIHHFEADIRDRAALMKVFRQADPEVVFHLAAQPLVRKSYEDPVLTVETNVIGSLNVLEAVRAMPHVKSLVLITSDKCYMNKEWIWGYREVDELGGHDPYSASKAAAEIVFASYWNSFFDGPQKAGVATARAGNVLGGGDWAEDRIVPDCIRALRDGRKVIIRSPNATRPWQHVLEPLSGYLILASRLLSSPRTFSGSWNFGPQPEAIRSVRKVAEGIIARWGGGELSVEEQHGDVHESQILHLSIDKAIHALGWRPRWGFERGLDMTTEWYKSVLSGADAHLVSSSQIRAYMEQEA